MTDVVIIGGSYSGMAAALQLLRARRSVRIIDAGQRRNRFASHSHGFLTQDGVDPGVIAATARAQLERYRADVFHDGTGVQITGEKDGFEVRTEDGVAIEARRVLLATGVSDRLPDIPGLAERWGRSVFHCPYCHGYELNNGPIALLANGPEAIHHAPLFPEFGQTTFLTQGLFPLDAAVRQQLERHGLRLEERPVTAVTGPVDGPVTLHFGSGAATVVNGLFVATKTRPASDIGASIGVALEDTPMGRQYRTDGFKETSVPGIFACGDAAKMPHSVSLAVGDGAWAGACVHRSLVFDPHR